MALTFGQLQGTQFQVSPLSNIQGPIPTQIHKSCLFINTCMMGCAPHN